MNVTLFALNKLVLKIKLLQLNYMLIIKKRRFIWLYINFYKEKINSFSVTLIFVTL